MTTDERYDGEVHGLLATAFDDGLPLVNLVPEAVDGYRRHRRRARVLGTAGGALALAGVAVAGTALASGTGNISTTQSPASGSAGGTTVTTAPGCAGTYFRFGQYNGSGVYSADQHRLAAVCDQDLTALRALTGDTGLAPLAEKTTTAIAKHDLPAGATPPPSDSGVLIQPGYYDGRINGVAYRISILVSDKTAVFSGHCTAQSCPPNRTLADGRPATELASGVNSDLVIHYDATHSVSVSAFLTERTTAKNVPFDFEKLIASPGFAQLISADIHTLDQLTHPA